MYQKMSSPSYLFMVLTVLAFCEAAVLEKVRTSVMNRLGSGKSINLHCQSKDNDLGEHTVADGGEFGWEFSVNVIGTTLFYCDVSWENFGGFHFDAYSFERDWGRCESRCLWLISKEGMYGWNQNTGFWEFMYSWPN